MSRDAFVEPPRDQQRDKRAAAVSVQARIMQNRTESLGQNRTEQNDLRLPDSRKNKLSYHTHTHSVSVANKQQNSKGERMAGLAGARVAG